jgi:hypothetical protein
MFGPNGYGVIDGGAAFLMFFWCAVFVKQEA